MVNFIKLIKELTMQNPIKIALVLLYSYYNKPGTNPRSFGGSPRLGSLFILSVFIFLNIETAFILLQHSFFYGIYGFVIIISLVMLILHLTFKEKMVSTTTLENRVKKKAWILLISYFIISFCLFAWSSYNYAIPAG
jgi:hypothetical protein